MFSSTMFSLQSRASYTTTQSDQERWSMNMRPSGSGVWNTPLARSEHSTEMYGFSGKDSESCYERLAEETARVCVGPMPVDQFLREFLPVSAEILGRMPPYVDAFKECEDAKSEADLYQPLIRAINAQRNRHPERCPGFVLRNTSNRSDKSGGSIGSHKPDIMCYAKEHLKYVTLKGQEFGEELDAATDMGFAATFIEVKYPESMDCWTDPPAKDVDRASWPFALGNVNAFNPNDKKIQKALGQNAAYAIEIFARQHRGFLLSVSVSGEHARLVRWDRAGLIVSQAFDYISFPQYLCEFFWRFSHLSDAQRGYDLSVKSATLEEEKYFRRAVKLHITTQVSALTVDDDAIEYLSQTHYMANAVSAIHLPEEGDDPARKFLVSRPLTKPLSLTGRATRAYWAVEYDSSKPVPTIPAQMITLKDTWRLHDTYSGWETEGGILRQLQKAGVPNIPSVICDRDVHHDVADGKAVAGPSKRRFGTPANTSGLTPIEEDVAHDGLAPIHEGLSESPGGEVQSMDVDCARSTSNPPLEDAMDVDSCPGTCPLPDSESTSKQSYELDKTLTQFYLRSKYEWVCNRNELSQWVIPRRHYRLVMDVAGYTLLYLSGTLELLSGTYDAYQALKGAALLKEPYGPRLHRDVHPGNIILYRNPKDGLDSRRKGYLIDWDVSCMKDSSLHTGGNYLPSLQWQFLSTELLMKDNRKEIVHSLNHDTESMFWVVLFCGLVRLQHSEGDGRSLATIVQLLFDDVKTFKTHKGGGGKGLDMSNREYTGGIQWDCDQLRDWIKIVYDSFSPVKGEVITDCFDWKSAEELDRFWYNFINTRTLPDTNRYDNVRHQHDVLKYHTSRWLKSESYQAPTTATGSRRTAVDEPLQSPPLKPGETTRLASARSYRLQGSTVDTSMDPSSHRSRTNSTASSGKTRSSEDRLDVRVGAKDGNSGGSGRIIAAKRAKKQRPLYVQKNNYTGRNICKRWYRSEYPTATEKDFKTFWEVLPADTKEVWNEQGKVEKREGLIKEGLLAVPNKSRRGRKG